MPHQPHDSPAGGPETQTATHESAALAHARQLYLDRLERIKEAIDAAAHVATNEYLDMLVHDNPRRPLWPHNFWSFTVPFSLLWGVLNFAGIYWFLIK